MIFCKLDHFINVNNTCLIRSKQCVNVIKLFTAVSYDFLKYARAFVLGKPFQPSVTFAGKAGA